MTLKQLERRVAAMEQRLTALEKKKRRTNGHKSNGGRKTRARQTLHSNTTDLTEQEKQKRAIEHLRKIGMIVELPPQAKERAARWRALPEDEQKRILDEFARLPLEKPLSEIINENRR